MDFADVRELTSSLENFTIYPTWDASSWEMSYLYSYWIWHWAGVFMANRTRRNGEEAFFTLARLLVMLALEQRTPYSFEAYISFMHGAVWHMLATEKWAHHGANQFATRMCSDLHGKGKVFYDCWHGIGHGLAHQEVLPRLPFSYSTTVQIRLHGLDMGTAVDRALYRCMHEFNLTGLALHGCVDGVFHSYFNYLPRTQSRWEAHCEPYVLFRGFLWKNSRNAHLSHYA